MVTDVYDRMTHMPLFIDDICCSECQSDVEKVHEYINEIYKVRCERVFRCETCNNIGEIIYSETNDPQRIIRGVDVSPDPPDYY